MPVSAFTVVVNRSKLEQLIVDEALRKGVTIKQLSIAMGLDPDGLYRLIDKARKGKTIRPKTLKQVLNYLGVDIKEITE